MKWIGLGTMLLGIAALCALLVLSLLWAEPPVQAPWLLQPASKPGSVQTEILPAGRYGFAVEGLGPKDSCLLTARNASGHHVFREVERDVTGDGCHAYGTANAGDVWVLDYEPPTARVVAYTSHGDGFPHAGVFFLVALLMTVGGLALLVSGFMRTPQQNTH